MKMLDNTKKQMQRSWKRTKEGVIRNSKKGVAGLDVMTGRRLGQSINEFTTMYRDIVVGLGDHVDDHDQQLIDQANKLAHLESILQKQELIIDRQNKSIQSLKRMFLFGMVLSGAAFIVGIRLWILK